MAIHGGPSAAESDCICRHHNSGKSSRLQNLAEELKLSGPMGS